MPSRLPGTYLDATCVFGGREWLLLDLIDDWASRVLKFLDDMQENRDLDDGSAWNAWDLIGACYLRNAIHRCVGSGFPPDSDLPVLRASDELYRSLTVLVEQDICEIDGVEPAPHPDHWWWHRIPKYGSLADELTEIIKNVFTGDNRYQMMNPSIAEMEKLFVGDRHRAG